MTTIWMDPTELKAGAATLAEQAMRIQETMTGTRTTCSCEVPRSLIGWLDDELVRITEDALRVAVTYLEQAVDIATRANQIQADQSLAAAQAPLIGGILPSVATIGGGGPVFVSGMAPMTATIGGGGPSFDSGMASMTATIGGGGPVFESWMAPMTATVGGSWSNPLLDAARNLQDRNPAAAAQLLGVFSFVSRSEANMAGVWTNSRPGAAYIGDGLYRGDSGSIGGLGNVFFNNKTGRYEVIS